MAGLPKGLLKKIIEEGYDPPEAMKEAWKRVKLQQKRYATRMSYGGGYPLGYKAYKGKNPRKRKRKPHKISFNQWVKAVEREFDLVGVYPKWSGFTAKRLYKVYSPKKAAEKLILESKRRKNPVEQFINDSESIEWLKDVHLKNIKHPPFKSFILEGNEDYPTLIKLYSEKEPLYTDSPIFSITGKAIYDNPYRRKQRKKKNPSEYNRGYADGKAAKQMKFRKGTAKDLGKASPDYINGYVDGYKQRKPRKNPIAIYNPSKQKLLYGRAYIPVIRGIKTNGKYKGERYQHNFSKSNEVSIYGNTDGSITVKSNNNLRLWDYDKNI